MNQIFALAIVYAFFLGSPAYAYLDPITGSFLLQAIVGGVASAMIAVRRIREKILALVGIRRSVEDDIKVSEDRTKV